MNSIKAKIQKSEYGYNDYLQIVIDGNYIDELLEEKFPSNLYKGLVPTITSWMECKSERKIVWDRIIPMINSSANAPILMCPDDCDFSCTIIVAEIENLGNKIIWKRLGIDKTKYENNCPEKIGSNVEWFQKIEQFEFEFYEYRNVIDKFETIMHIEDVNIE